MARLLVVSIVSIVLSYVFKKFVYVREQKFNFILNIQTSGLNVVC